MSFPWSGSKSFPVARLKGSILRIRTEDQPGLSYRLTAGCPTCRWGLIPASRGLLRVIRYSQRVGTKAIPE